MANILKKKPSSLTATLRDLRKEKGYTQEMLARKIGSSISTIAMYETKRRKPNIAKVDALAKALGVSVETVLDCFLEET